MALRLLIGKTDSGKTEQIYSEMIKASEASSGQRSVLLIVPEQATLDAQRTLVNRHPRHCISGVEVLSFQRLAYRVSDDLGIAGKTLISDVGKHMLIRKIIESDMELFPFLSRYVHKKGYISELCSLLTEFSRYTLLDEDFELVQNAMEQSVLRLKIGDLKVLYNRYRQSLDAQFMSGETVMDRLVLRCQDSEFLGNAHIFIDGFYGFTPIQYRLIKKLMVTAPQLSVSVTIDPDALSGPMPDESYLYYESRLTYDTLKMMMSEDPSAEIEEVVLTSVKGNITKEFLRDNLYQYPYKQSSSVPHGLTLNRCHTVRQEMDYLRDSILKLVRINGYRYKDISVLSGNIDLYKQVLSEKFSEADIPYYVDDKKPATANEGVSFVLNLVKLYAANLNYTTVFEYLKSDFVDVDHDLLDYMENYVIRYGVRGFTKWSEEWIYKVPDIHKRAEDAIAVDYLGRLNECRDQWVTPILNSRVSGKQPVGTYIRSLYDLLILHRLEEKLQAKADQFHKCEQFGKSREYNQIYQMIIDLLDQLMEMSDEKPIDYKEFVELLEAGFEALELGLVPANVDQVIIGDLTRSRISKRSACFVIGVNEGVIPSLNENTGLLTDDERTILESMGMTLAPTAKTGLFREQFYIYMALLRYEEKLYLSFTTTDEDGKASRPSHLLTMIGKILTEVKVNDVEALYEDQSFGSTPKVAYEKHLEVIRLGKQVNGTVRSWLEQNEPWNDKLKEAMIATREDLRPKLLNRTSNMGLYGLKLSNSVSRLEQFSSCPFAHFMTYGLNAREREVYEITMPHLGMIFHRVIELFSKRLIRREMDWQDVTDKLRTKWVDELLEEVLGEDSYTVFFDNNRNKYRIIRLKKMIDRALWTITWQICQGDFRPLDAEWRFDGNDHALDSVNIELSDNRKMSLKGTIDRVDHYQIAGMDYITVVDYKSSTHDFDVNRLYAGLQLQLIVYLNAACEIKEAAYGEVLPAGVFYFKIDDPFVNSRKALSQEDKDKEVLGKMCMSGVVVEDEQVIKALDRSFSKKSKVIPVSRKNDGDLSKASRTLGQDDFDVLRRYTTMKIAALGDSIMNGHIETLPYKDKKGTACDYCGYNSVCQFDEKIPDHKFREVIEEEQSKVISKIKLEVSGLNVV